MIRRRRWPIGQCPPPPFSPVTARERSSGGSSVAIGTVTNRIINMALMRVENEAHIIETHPTGFKRRHCFVAEPEAVRTIPCRCDEGGSAPTFYELK